MLTFTVIFDLVLCFRLETCPVLPPSHRLVPRSHLPLQMEVPPALTEVTRLTDLQPSSTGRLDLRDHRVGEVELLLLTLCRFRRCWTRTAL